MTLRESKTLLPLRTLEFVPAKKEKIVDKPMPLPPMMLLERALKVEDVEEEDPLPFQGEKERLCAHSESGKLLEIAKLKLRRQHAYSGWLKKKVPKSKKPRPDIAIKTRATVPLETLFPVGHYNPISFIEPLQFPKFPKLNSEDLKPSELGSIRYPAVWKQEKIDVVDFLKGSQRDFLVTNSGKKAPLEELRGSYVVIACFLVPKISCFARCCHALIRLSEELCARQVTNCKFVIVIKVRQFVSKRWRGASLKSAFHQFLYGFPKHFLAIPFEDYYSRCRVLRSLASHTKQPLEDGLIVDPEGKILGTGFNDLVKYAGAYYPFSKEHVSNLNKQDDLLWNCFSSFYGQKPPKDKQMTVRHSDVSLAQVLECEPEDHLLVDAKCKSHPVSTLMRGQLVGLYLCVDGNFMDSLNQLYKQCRDRDPRFEVLIVPLAASIDLQSCFNYIMIALAKLNISSWWVLCPTSSDKVARSLWRLLGMKDSDKFLLLPSKDNSNYDYCGEVYPQAVLSLLGLYPSPYKTLPDNMYPFTAEKLYINLISAVRQVNLPSLLGESGCSLLCKCSEQLKGKTVLLFPATLNWIDAVHELVPQIVACHSDCQVFCVLGRTPTVDLPFPILPRDETQNVIKALFTRNLLGGRRIYVLVAFGEDGRICSRFEDWPTCVDDLFQDRVDQEVFDEVNNAVRLKAAYLEKKLT